MVLVRQLHVRLDHHDVARDEVRRFSDEHPELHRRTPVVLARAVVDVDVNG